MSLPIGPHLLTWRAILRSPRAPALDLTRLVAQMPRWFGLNPAHGGPLMELPCEPDPNPWVALDQAEDPTRRGSSRWQIVVSLAFEVVGPGVTDDMPARSLRVALWDAGLRAEDGNLEVAESTLQRGTLTAPRRTPPAPGFSRVRETPGPGDPAHQPRTVCPIPRAAPATRTGGPSPGSLPPDLGPLDASVVTVASSPPAITDPPAPGLAPRRRFRGHGRQLVIAAVTVVTAATAAAVIVHQRR